MEKYEENIINEVVLASEVAEFLGKTPSTLRKAIDAALKNGTLIDGVDCRKARQTWLMKKEAVVKLYPNVSMEILKDF